MRFSSGKPPGAQRQDAEQHQGQNILWQTACPPFYGAFPSRHGLVSSTYRNYTKTTAMCHPIMRVSIGQLPDMRRRGRTQTHLGSTMSDELPQEWRSFQPVRATDHSPPFQRRVADWNWNESRQGRQNSVFFSKVFFRPSRLRSASMRLAGVCEILGRDNPTMNCRAIFGCPGGTDTNGGVEK